MSTRELVTKVILFCEEVNGIEFYAYQKVSGSRIVESLLLSDGANISCLFSRQSGKSEMVSSIAIGLCIVLPTLAAAFPNDDRLAPFANGIWIGVFAPKLELSGPIYEKIRDRAHTDRAQEVMADPSINVMIRQSRGDSLAFSNGSIVRAHTASEQSMQEGKTYHLVLIDEAQKVSASKVRKEIQPMLTATHGTMVKIGTAWMSRGGFHNDIQFNLDWEQRTGVRNHFQFDYEQVIAERRALFNRQMAEYKAGKRKAPPLKLHLNYEASVTDELARLNGNKDSEEFKMNYRLLWQESRSIAIKEHVFREQAMSGIEANIPKHFGALYAGLDIAKNNDSTVLTILEVDKTNPLMDVHPGQDPKSGERVLVYRKFILGWLELQGSFEQLQYKAIVDYLGNFRVQHMLVDSTGMGDPVCERLQVLLAPLGVDVQPYKYTTASKSDVFKFLLNEFDARRIFYPAGEYTIRQPEYNKFCQEMLELEREYNGSYLMCEAPEGSHDDFPNSLALANWATRTAIQPMVEVEDNAYLYGSHARMAWGGHAVANDRASRYMRSRRR